jgi:UDP-N-acetylglucosamine 2-epimerase (non-hydrolysing)
MTAEASKKILVVFGTRPEAIKMAPVIKALENEPDRFRVITCVTGQHREMLDEMLRIFELRPHIDLRLMQHQQSLADLTARAMRQVSDVFARTTPDFTLVQGDTTTAMTTAMASFYARIPVGHIEAGLRTSDRFNPFPEEINRRIIGTVADLHFAPTPSAARALLAEGVPPSDVFVTGNTVIDALHMAIARAPLGSHRRFSDRERYILVTAHRRESFGEPIRRICEALRRIAARHPDVGIIYPVHPNPEIRTPVRELLQHVDGVQLLEPLGYVDFVECLRGAHLVLTDSGGVQEEAPALGKPVLVVRETTERPEAVEAGVARVVGTQVSGIVEAVDELLTMPEVHGRMARASNPFGDGQASARIARALEGRLFGDRFDGRVAEACA